MYKLFCIVVLALGVTGFAMATPETTTSSSSTIAVSTNASSYQSSHKSSYSFSNKYCGHGWHNKPKYKTVYKTCKKWKRNTWWWGHQNGKVVKYVCEPQKPASP